ncbi:Gfo/Idh/MocA family protein [Nocardioides zeae]|uniref:Gfo/Idh/MocA family oxidoreductase n=1 Tax=Nocardioides zeae TaxID=1457234 RepID=A0A6P0HMV0_9ACTN|nr:Gfo/Idh/MocA family oxidoreductase [Nocardioides zeae]NEN79554.1 Gfo/Idh/MocA family oxidoreductase [Nocardioides zeae]
MSRALFCGYGWAARTLWRPALRDVGFVEFGALDSFVPAEDLRAAGADRVHDDLSSVRKGDYDVAVVATPNRSHVDLAVGLLERGIPTVVEKPVCLRLDDVNRMREAAGRGDVPLLRSRSTHYEPHLVSYLHQVRALSSARPVRLSIAWTRAQGLPRSRWLTRASHAGAGSSIDLGWHLLECVFEVTGWTPLSLTASEFIGGAGDEGRASWHGAEEYDAAEPVDVDVAADLRFDQKGGDVRIRTAWVSVREGDEVVIDASLEEGHVRLVTLFGTSPSSSSTAYVETESAGGAVRSRLPSRRPGDAHTRMVADYVAEGFSAARLGQSWEQLEMLAGATESIVSHHARWRAAEAQG